MQLTIMDWGMIGLLSVSIIFFWIFLILTGLFFVTKSQLNTIKRRRPKRKAHQKKWRRRISNIQKNQKKRIRKALGFLMIGVLCLGSSLYIRYQQQTTLSQLDSEALVQGYFLVNNIEEQLTNGLETEERDKVQANLYKLSAQLAAYGATIPDVRISKEGKLLLKRLYTSMKQLGLNLNGLILDDQTVIEDYLTDVSKLKDTQKRVIDYFRIDEASLKQ